MSQYFFDPVAAYQPPPAPAPAQEQAPLGAGAYVPPRPQVARAPRMPQISDLPPHTQAQIRMSRNEVQQPEPQQDSKRMTLLRRLATVGFGGRREEAEAAPLPPTRAAAPVPPSLPAQPRIAAPQPPQYRPAQGQLDAQGRLAPQPRLMDDDQLEIPAFLRRQAN